MPFGSSLLFPVKGRVPTFGAKYGLWEDYCFWTLKTNLHQNEASGPEVQALQDFSFTNYCKSKIQAFCFKFGLFSITFFTCVPQQCTPNVDISWNTSLIFNLKIRNLGLARQNQDTSIRIPNSGPYRSSCSTAISWRRWVLKCIQRCTNLAKRTNRQSRRIKYKSHWTEKLSQPVAMISSRDTSAFEIVIIRNLILTHW